MNNSVKQRMHLNKEKKNSLLSLALIICLVAGGVFAFLQFYDAYIDKILYAERLNQMKEVTTQLFSGLEDVVKNEWKETQNQSLHLIEKNPKTLNDMLGFMKKEVKLSQLKKANTSLIAVDEKGNYYTQKGRMGLLYEKSYLISQPKRVSFVSNFIISDDTRMVYLQKLSNPITLQDGKDTIHIKYYGISQSMEELNPYFECTAYDNSNNMYVVDNDGFKLFTSGDTKLLNGYNTYSVLNGLNYLHGSSYISTKKELEKNGIAYSNAILNDEEIYYAMYHMENAQWTLIFMVPSKYVAINTVEIVNVTMRIVLIFAVLMVGVSAIIIFWMLKRQQKLAIAAERKNSEALAKLNGELEEAVKEADAANKAKSDFLANMSHDIRTPMNAIVGITSLIEREEGTSDKLHSYIEKVQLSSRHLLGLINDILDMSRIESNEVKLNKEGVSLAEQVSQIDNIIRAQANEKNQQFHILANEIVHEYLICDGVRFRQILINLLSNSVKYTQDGGRIELILSEIDYDKPDFAKFVFTVKDNGYGMSPDFVEHIFEPFTRAENSVTNKVQGTGLGMAITKNIVDLMGGEICVDSELGKGSCFNVVLTLPIDRNVDNEIRISRVLLISDDEKLISNVKASFRESPIELIVRKTEEELILQNVDVILLQSPNLANKLRKIVDEKVFIFELGSEPGMIPYPFFLSNLLLAIDKMQVSSDEQPEDDTILNGMNFLCAEDNELNAEILEELLGMYGAACTIYSNGEEIVEAFKNVGLGEYDAILMDVQMPKMNGLEATKAIREGENALGKTIPIIAMTANAFAEDVQHCLKAGMDAHIAKPIDIAMLEKTVRGFVSGGGDEPAQ